MSQKYQEEYDNAVDMLVYVTAAISFVGFICMTLETEKPVLGKGDEED